MQHEEVIDFAQLSQIVRWLDDQRKRDKENADRAHRDLERLSLRVNELIAQVQQIGEDVKSERSRLASIPFAEEGIKQLREQLTILQQRMDAYEQGQDRDALLRQTEMERDKRMLAELAKQMADLSQQNEQGSGTLRMLLEDTKRGRVEIAALAERLEASEKFGTDIAGRTQLVEEYVKRFDGRIAMLEQVQEMLKTEFAQFNQWRQAAELRWGRQARQWYDSADERNRDIDDRVKSVQHLPNQMSQLKDEIRELRGELEASRKRLEDQSAELLRLENVRSLDHDNASKLEQSLEVQRRRADEQADTLKMLQEQLLRNAQEFMALQSRLESERKRLDESFAWLRQFEARQKQAADEMIELHRLLREQNQAIAQQTQAWQRQLHSLQLEWEQQVVDLHQLAEQQKSREVAELERQLLEIKDRMNRLRGKVKS